VAEHQPQGPRRVILTGASGFIGRHCVAPLCARGFEIHGVTSQEVAPDIAGVTWHHLSLHDTPSVERLCQRIGATHLLHLGWSFGPGGADGAPKGSCPGHFQWTQTSMQLVRGFREAGGRRAVCAGSSQEYDWTSGVCAEFTTARKPSNYYGVCKNALFELLTGYADHVALSLAWARIFFVYGPHEPPSRLLPSVIRSVLRGAPALCSHGSQVRDYLYVTDVADALVATLESDIQGPINIGSQQPIALRDLVSGAAERLGGGHLVRFGAVPARTTDVPLLVANTTRLQAEVGWSPRVSLADGLDRTVEFWREQLAGDTNDPQPSCPGDLEI
jgi:nucleoside-diphosphate-sugar epimerase